jgi:iron complex outermembrane receptor protein
MMLAYIDIAFAAPELLALQWGVGPVVALLPSLVLAIAGLLAVVAPAFAQDAASEAPAAEEPAAEEAAPAPEPLVATPGDPAEAPATDAEEPATVVPTVPLAQAEEAPPREEAGTRLDTIEVTASKRLKSQRDIPGSVNAMRGDELEKMRAQSMSDYLKRIPGVSLSDYGADRQVPVIRGIASGIDQNQFTAYTTGVYLEEMPFNDLFLPLTVPDLNPFDLERVEVLKGPQGTLFGASALAGAIRYIAQKPNLGVWQGKLSSTLTQNEFSDEPSHSTAAAVNAPLGDSLALRVVGLYRRNSGLYDSRANNSANRPDGGNTREEHDIDRSDQVTGRALLKWQATDTLTLQGLAFGQDTEQDDEGSARTPDRFERNDVPFPSPAHSRFQGANLTAANEFDWGRLFYSGNRLDKRFKTRAQSEPALPEELGNQEADSWYNYVKGRIQGYAHELRVSSPEGGHDVFEWLLGGSYLTYTQDFFQFAPNPGPSDQGYYANPPEDRDDVPEADRPIQWLYATVDGDATEQALFGEVSARLGDHWEATLGARAFETQLSAVTLFQGAQITALDPGSGTQTITQFDLKESGLNPKASLRYLHDDTLQSYVLVSRGFQFGGVQINPPIANTEQATEAQGLHFGPYKSSVLWNYEVGLRTEWLDRRVRFDLAAFYLDWTDLQLTVQVGLSPFSIPPNPYTPQNVPIDVIVNVGAAHSEGLEASLSVVPFAGATYTSSAAWISALTDEDFDTANEAGPVKAGTRLPGTPRFQWSNVFEYEHALPFFDAWQGGFSLAHAHIGSAPDSLRPLREVGGYDTLDVSTSLVRLGTPWFPEIGLGVNNLTDVRATTAYQGDGTSNFYFLVRPRTTLLTLAWSY